MTKVIGDYNAAITIDGSTNYLLIQPGSSSVAYNKINRNTFLGVSGQPADISTVQNLTNKTLDNTNTVTLKDTLFTLQDDGDTSKQAKFQLSGITTATTRTYTLPNASSTLADIATSQVFTNKTLTSPVITGGTYDNGTITVDSIGGHTSPNIVTVAGLQISSGVLNSNNSVVTANIADSAVTPAKLVTGTGSGWTWQSWTPTFTNLTVGNGVLACDYTQIGKTVIANLTFTLGTTSAVGTAPTFTLPVTSVSLFTGHWLGGLRMVVAGGGYSGYVQWASTTTGLLLAMNVNGTNYVNDTSANFTAAIPAVWATGNSFAGTIIYQAA